MTPGCPFVSRDTPRILDGIPHKPDEISSISMSPFWLVAGLTGQSTKWLFIANMEMLIIIYKTVLYMIISKLLFEA